MGICFCVVRAWTAEHLNCYVRGLLSAWTSACLALTTQQSKHVARTRQFRHTAVQALDSPRTRQFRKQPVGTSRSSAVCAL